MDKTLQVPKKSIKLGKEEFDIYPKEAMAGARAIEYAWTQLGRPQDPFSEAGGKLMNVLIAVWEDLYPKDAYEWHESRKNYKANEMTVSEQVSKGTGRSLASYPFPLYQMMQKVFRGFDPGERKNCLSMCKKWPMFQMANRV